MNAISALNPLINLESRKERSKSQILDAVAACCVVLGVGHVFTLEDGTTAASLPYHWGIGIRDTKVLNSSDTDIRATAVVSCITLQVVWGHSNITLYFYGNFWNASRSFTKPGFLYYQTKGKLLPQPGESVRWWVSVGVGVKCPGWWISLCALLKVALTGPFVEASGNRLSDFGAKETREQTEAGATAKLLVWRCGLAPILHPVQTRALYESWREHKQGGDWCRETWISQGRRPGYQMWRQNIWGSMTNTWENLGFPHFPIATKNKKLISYQHCVGFYKSIN